MPSDLHDLLARFTTAVLTALVPVALVAALTVPPSLHHHIRTAATLQDVVPEHMT